MRPTDLHSSVISLLYLCIYVVPALTDTTSTEPVNFYQLPGLLGVQYSKPGDINIGAVSIVSIESGTHPAEACSTELHNPQHIMEATEAVAHTIDAINHRPDILPNITFGFILQATCRSPGVNLGTSLSFLPRTPMSPNDQCHTENSCWQNYDVIGIMSPGYSSLAVPLSSLYSVANLPIVGPTETSDELSKKDKYPYFFRVSTPDSYIVQAILRFLSSNGWSYVSVLYVDDAYGQSAFDKLQENVDQFGVCIATSHRLRFSTDYDHVVSDLLVNSRARAVVLFVFGNQLKNIMKSVLAKNATGHFIWIGYVESYLNHGSSYDGSDNDPAVGTISFDFYAPRVTEFYDYIKNQNVLMSKNPWMKQFWEYFYECSLDEGNCPMSMDISQSSKYKPNKSLPLRMNAVLSFAQAAHDLLSERCPDARGKEARTCITGPLLREYLKNVSFDGYAGRVEFDENQEVKGKYSINQFVYDRDVSGMKHLVSKRMGTYDVLTEKISYTPNATFEWSYFKKLKRVVTWTKGSLPIEIPESVCSRPCVTGEYKIEKELSCCWECRRCRDNERLVRENTSCEVCPQFMWPDSTSAFTTCIDIPLTYSTLEETIPIVLLSLSIFAIVIDIIITITYIIYRNERVIKASSRELSVIQLVAIFGGYVNVIVFQTKPTQTACTVIFFLFCMTFVMLYSPLLVKTIRIFRIFQSGKTNKQNLRFISPGSQLFIAILLIVIQITLSTVSFVLFSPGAHRTQPIWSEKYVELSCDLTLPGLASFLGYNIVLVSLCSIFAFKTRKLPDNFNESQFISMCVSTTLLIWLAFIPTYFTADREFVRVFLLSVALLINHSVALTFLFMPKIYAAIFLPTETGSVSGKKS